MTQIREYIDAGGRSRYAEWFNGLDPRAAAKAATVLVRMEQGNYSNVKGVGAGIFECRINFGPGYRIYFGEDGNEWVILLGGGTKQRQRRDIEDARRLWQEYKKRKPQEE